MSEVQRVHGKPLRDLLIELYAEYGTGAAVSAALGISVNTLYVWVMRCGLEPKTILVDRVLTSEVKS